MDLYDVISFFSGLVQFAGLLVFGVGVGVLTVNVFQQPEQRWQLQMAIVLGFFFLSAVVAAFVTPGGVGAFGLGAGGALLFWGVKKGAQSSDASEED